MCCVLRCGQAMDAQSQAIDEDSAKKLFRQAWEYSQRIDKMSKSCQHSEELFGRNFLAVRHKLTLKCSEVILSGSTLCRKAEELMWKRAVYDVVQRCKQSRQLYEGSSLQTAYHHHLSNALVTYQKIIADLDSKFGYGPSGITELQELGPLEGHLNWLKEIYYTVLLRLGDLCRYQVDIGGSSADGKSFYEQAISLDPFQGRGYNQMAALSGDSNHGFHSLYYYQRSLVSQTPCQLSLTNLQKIYDKNRERFESIRGRSHHHLLEPSVREESRKIVLIQFIRLQQLLSPTTKSDKEGASERELVSLSERVVSGLLKCLEYDLILYQESCSEKVESGLGFGVEHHPRSPGINNLACFSSDDLLQLTAMVILPSYSLRSLGSTYTSVASQFALSVLSELLSLSYKRITSLLYCYLKDKLPAKEAESMLEGGASLVEILLKLETLDSAALSPAPPITAEAPPKTVSDSSKVDTEASDKTRGRSITAMDTKLREKVTTQRKRLNQKVIDRRRQRGQRLASSGSSEEEEELSDSSLSLPSEEESDEDIQVLDSLSDNSGSDEEGRPAPTQRQEPSSGNSPLPSSSKVAVTGRRQIVLAASFNLAPTKGPPADEKKENNAESSSITPVGVADCDPLLKEVYSSSVYESTVHLVCSILAEDSYLVLVKVFTEWLHTYPIVIATCRQISLSLWSNLASLLNLLPTREQLSKAKLPVVKEQVEVGLALLPEEVILRGFPPLVDAQKKRSPVKLLRIEETVSRIITLVNFGHFVSELRMAPQFTWNSKVSKFVGPSQKAYLEDVAVQSSRLEEDKMAKLTRSKLMKAMAQQRLKSEVASLAEAKAKVTTVFTPYIIPDASVLCSGLHLVKKMIKSEKFIIVVPLAVIETLDQMKKGRENYSVREAIKFLESQLVSGSKFIRTQKATETLIEGVAKKPSKMDIKAWRYKCLVDCGLYLSDQCGSGAEQHGTVTLLLDKELVALMDGSAPGPSRDGLQLEIIKTIEFGEQSGLEVDAVLPFYTRWQTQSKKKNIK